MIQKNEATKALLAEGLKNLIVKLPFEKITIKMITDEAGVVRPTFYNYFKDKYELLEWIFSKDVMEKVQMVTDSGMSTAEAMKLFFVLIEKDKLFYKRAFMVTGQNAFEKVVEGYLYQMFLERLEKFSFTVEKMPVLVSTETIANYYTVDVINILKQWLFHRDAKITAEEVAEAYFFIITHSLYDVTMENDTK